MRVIGLKFEGSEGSSFLCTRTVHAFFHASGTISLPDENVLNLFIYKLNIQIQISLMIGNLYLAGLITDNFIEKIETYYIYERANAQKNAVNKKEGLG